jgi:hypothetical protein
VWRRHRSRPLCRPFHRRWGPCHRSHLHLGTLKACQALPPHPTPRPRQPR